VAAQWGDLFRQLLAEKRAARAVVGDEILWVAAERIKTFSILFPGARFETQPAEIDEPVVARDDALLQLVRGWMAHSGPIDIPWLARTVRLPAADIEAAMLRLEGEGRVLRGQFTAAAPLLSEEGIKGWCPTTEWCDRRLLARIHRLTLGTLRKEIQPVTRAQFVRWLPPPARKWLLNEACSKSSGNCKDSRRPPMPGSRTSWRLEWPAMIRKCSTSFA
jgi:ATP-dependent Lhr-like helicase